MQTKPFKKTPKIKHNARSEIKLPVILFINIFDNPRKIKGNPGKNATFFHDHIQIQQYVKNVHHPNVKNLQMY